MSAILAKPLMTVEELLALPENGTERWLIRGRLREKPMTKRNRTHARIEARIAHLLLSWLDQQPTPRGAVYSGEAGCILRRNPDTSVGIDVVYISPDLSARQGGETTMIDGPPTLAVEILSPNEVQEEIDEKIEDYLAAGVALVWIVHPRFQTVTVYRPGRPPELFNATQEIAAEPHLPGFRVPVARIFE